jgi:molecular chaperone DnaK
MYLGIDLGTSNSSVAGNVGSDFRIFRTAEGGDILPSVLYVDKRGHKLFGKRAYDQTLLSPENVAAGFKRLMGTSTKIELLGAGVSFLPEECSAEILKQLIAQAFTESGSEAITGTVITIPAAFNQMQSEATLRAAKLAGLENVALLQEPIAAAMAAISQSRKKSCQFLVYDLGGGTFDLALVQSLSGTVSVLAHEGINMLGGRDFDRILVNSIVRPWLQQHFKLPDDFQKDEKYRRVLRIAQLAAERAKIELSNKEQETIFASDEEVRVTDLNGKDIYLEVSLLRSDLERLVEEELGRTVELSRKILKDNGYSPSDIDRIVFVGGPTKMPIVRRLVPQELGIPADVQIDPMTAVALGAAIYAESRQWDSGGTTRKASRASMNPEGGNGIKIDFPARTSDEKAKVRFKISEGESPSGYEFQIDSTTGWTSGRKTLSNDTSVDLPLSNFGENSFRAIIFDSQGKPLKQEGSEFKIVRTHASSAGIPATQTIAVRVRESSESSRNILHPLIKKGTLLPAEGVQKFRAGKDLKGGDCSEYLEFALYQDEGALEPELNLCIGVFKISGDDLQEGCRIREGDEIIFNWKMGDSGLLNATLDLPQLNQVFDTPKFYVAQAGHESFDLETGGRLANTVLDKAKADLEEVKQALDDDSSREVEKVEQELNKQEELLRSAQDSDTTRAITEKTRHLRQEISSIKHAPQNRIKILSGDIKSKEVFFNSYCRESAEPRLIERFDSHFRSAKECLVRGDVKSLQEAERHLQEMDSIITVQLWQDPEYLLMVFQRQVERSYLASNKDEYDAAVKKGIEAVKEKNSDELRRIIFRLSELQITVGGADDVVIKAASILRA